jgi:hypothetical protein
VLRRIRTDDDPGACLVLADLVRAERQLMVGLALAGLVALSLIGIGCFALVAPGASAQQYGIVLEERRALAFLRAMGVRDLVVGVLLLLLVAAGQHELLALGMAASAAIAVLDYVVVKRDGAGGTALLLHGAGAAGLLFAALLIALGV